MKIAILGYGKEGQAAEAYFKSHGDTVEVIQHIDRNALDKFDISCYDMVLRSPSIPPRAGLSSGTQYFFDHCPAPIIGVTGTKGKGTTCTMIADLLKALGHHVYLLGNIGRPALTDLDKITKNDIVIFELSSFQLWDLTKSPHIAVVLRIEPDHLNVHKDFADYVEAKSHIAAYQSPEDSIIYFRDNQSSAAVAAQSPGHHIPYPDDFAKLQELLDALTVPGQHNREDAEAALLAVAAFYGITLPELVQQHFDALRTALAHFHPLPHHIEFVRTLHGVSYYDDSFSTTEPSLEAALKSFPSQPLFLIAGGQDKKTDLTATKRLIFSAPNLKKAILLGEIREKIADGEDPDKVILVDSLEEAVQTAQTLAEKLTEDSVVLLSPAAASLDMFESYYQRGDLFKEYVKKLAD